MDEKAIRGNRSNSKKSPKPVKLLITWVVLCGGNSILAQVNMEHVVSIEVYSMALSTTTRFDYSPAFLISSVDSVDQNSSNAANRFKVQLTTAEVNRIWPKLSKLIDVPDSSARMPLDCRIVVQLTTSSGEQRQVSLNGAKQAAVEGYRLHTGNRIFQLIRKVVPDIGQQPLASANL